jgi:Ca2+-binding EF-hand superfamily protein
VKFNLFSKDDGKTIKRDDALQVIRCVGQNPSKRVFESSIKLAGLNNHDNEFIDFDEFYVLIWHAWNRNSTETDDLKIAFKKFGKV